MNWGSADSLSGESKTNFVNVLEELNLPDILAIRHNHRLWLPQEQEVDEDPWQTFEGTFSNGTTESALRQVSYSKRHLLQYWLLTSDPQTLADNSTSFVMVAAPALTLK